VAEPTLALADSHTHIDMEKFDGDRGETIARAREAGVADMLVIAQADSGVGLQDGVEKAEAHSLPASGGLHPHEAKLWSDALLDQLRGLAREGRIKAIGEAGLDFYYDHSPRDQQARAFRAQIRLAREVGLPVIVHSRDADSETVAILEEEKAGECGGVIHCFTGGEELAKRALALGLYLSFSGIMTFPKSAGIQEVARQAPRDRILVETDAPFLAPPPHRGKRNEPLFVVEVAKKLALVRGESLEEVGGYTLANYRRLFRVSPANPASVGGTLSASPAAAPR
jgi:TatD DNase family protein